MGIRERKERERERRRQQIMVAAKRVFSHKGFGKTTMEDIAEDAELSPGTLYLYFKNKDELYASLSLRVLMYLLVRMEHIAAEANQDPERLLEALREAMYDVYAFEPQILCNMFRIQSREVLKHLRPELLAEIETMSRNALTAMGRVFEGGIRQGVYAETDPLMLSHIIWAIFSGIVQWEESQAAISGNAHDPKPIFDMAFDIFKRGIRTHTFPLDLGIPAHQKEAAPPQPVQG